MSNCHYYSREFIIKQAIKRPNNGTNEFPTDGASVVDCVGSLVDGLVGGFVGTDVVGSGELNHSSMCGKCSFSHFMLSR